VSNQIFKLKLVKPQFKSQLQLGFAHHCSQLLMALWPFARESVKGWPMASGRVSWLKLVLRVLSGFFGLSEGHPAGNNPALIIPKFIFCGTW